MHPPVISMPFAIGNLAGAPSVARIVRMNVSRDTRSSTATSSAAPAAVRAESHDTGRVAVIGIVNDFYGQRAERQRCAVLVEFRRREGH